MLKINSFLISVLVLSTLLGCKEQERIYSFESNFDGVSSRTWIGPEYWANPMQDWQLENDRIACLVSNENRNVHHLTRQLGSQKGAFQMQVSLGVLNTDPFVYKNWIGFSIGARGDFGDYRNHAVFGKGLNIGIGTNGSLFIGEPNKNNTNKTVIEALKKGVDFRIEGKPNGKNYKIDVSVYQLGTSNLLSSISKENVSAEKLIGNLVLVSNFQSKNKERNYTKSVWFKDWKIGGTKIVENDNQSFGPILFSQYTLSRNVLKLTAQMAPVNHPTKQVDLQLFQNEKWETLLKAPIDKDARTATFKIEDWNDTSDVKYRLVYNLEMPNLETKEYYWEGTIRKNPKDKAEIKVAGFTGNNDLGFPNTDIYDEVALHNPDVLFFSGDQIYEEVGGYYIQLDKLEWSKLDYLRKWYMFGWAYRDLLKDRPTICLTDDHDVYQGNIWGESGRPTPIKTGHRRDIQDSGGYRMDPEWVRMVERTQTSHLPDPYDATPVKQNIGVYYTSMNYGEVSFAILEDRKFKSAPKALLPNAKVSNGWPENKEFNLVKNGDVKGATLLGERQLTFLNDWASDWSKGAQMKTLLSQTIFANVATLPKEALSDVVVPTLRIMKAGDYPPNDIPVGDMDSNGWPQTGRNRAVETIRKGFAFHLAGDQHLGSTIQYGVKDWNDSGYAFCVPSISNYWPRRWYPKNGGQNRLLNDPKYTGDFKDGFGNKFTVKAISNPLFTGRKPAKLYDRAAGYGIVKFNKESRDITIECWPRGSKMEQGDSEQYPGWPITINQQENYLSKAVYALPEVKIEGLSNAVIQVLDEAENNIVYTLRIKGTVFRPKVSKKGMYSISVEEPDSGLKQIIKGLKSSKNNTNVIAFKF